MTTMTVASGAEATLDDGTLTFETDADRERWRNDALDQDWTIGTDGRMVAPFTDMPYVALRLAVRSVTVTSTITV